MKFQQLQQSKFKAASQNLADKLAYNFGYNMMDYL